MDTADLFSNLISTIEERVAVIDTSTCAGEGQPNLPMDEEAFGVRCETDAHRIRTRARQIEIGKNTIGYRSFISKYPRFFMFS